MLPVGLRSGERLTPLYTEIAPVDYSISVPTASDGAAFASQALTIAHLYEFDTASAHRKTPP